MSKLKNKPETDSLKVVDPGIHETLVAEQKRQQDNLIMIASENLVSKAVLEAQGSVLTNKYAEGYSGARYYGGCLCADRAEDLACSRAKKVFNAEHVNIQPHSGTSANMAVFLALLKPGDRILGMDLSHGGHLTHGSKVNISGRYYDSFSYQVEPDSCLLDLDRVRDIAREIKPGLMIAGASSYPREIDFAGFADIAAEVNAVLLVDIAHTVGLVAAGLHNNPVLSADIVTATTHKTFRGPRGGMIFCKNTYAAAIDKAVFPGLQGGPLMHIIAAKAVALKESQQPDYIEYQKAVLKNAAALADGLVERGFDLVTGGTNTHLVLVDLRNKDISGKDAEKLLEDVNITVNKNVIPYDPRGANNPSGIRLGSPTLTSRGMKMQQMKEIAALIDVTIKHRGNSVQLEKVKRRVADLCLEYPAY
ncbi:MAG: serine hydroxymethyltransferase [Bacillota bacterium]